MSNRSTSDRRPAGVTFETGNLPMPTYDVTIIDGHRIDVHRRVSYIERNRLADFAFRHDLTFRCVPHKERIRGEGTYR